MYIMGGVMVNIFVMLVKYFCMKNDNVGIRQDFISEIIIIEVIYNGIVM